MPTPFPSVRGGVTQALYPFTRRIRFQTGLYVNANGSEQRCAGRGVPLFEFSLTFNELTQTDRDAINTFHAGQFGMFGQSWQITILGKTYTNLKFADDVLIWTEKKPLRYSSIINIGQVQNPGYTIPTPAGTFPNLSSGVLTQLPYGPAYRQLNSVNDQPSGPAYAYHWYGGGLTGFPTGAMKGWGLSNPALRDADIAIIENQFVGCLGMWQGFSIVDPETSITYTNCRFSSDVLEINYKDYKLTEINFGIVQTNG